METKKINKDISFERICNELPHQYLELKEWDKLYDFLLDFEVFDYIYKKNEYELGKYWRTLQKENKEKYSLEKFLELDVNDKSQETIWGYYHGIGSFASNLLTDYALSIDIHQKALAMHEKAFGMNQKTFAGFEKVGLAILLMLQNRIDT